MTQNARTQRRDDSAWPRGAAPISLTVGVISLVVGLVMVGQAEAPLVPLLVLVAGLGIGATLIVVGVKRWLDGGTVPIMLAVISGVSAVVGVVLIGATDGPTGPALLCGLIGGLMLGNVWAVRTARKRRLAAAD
jgi:ABC-type Mn2+/Zn2+ transport system permease subunit